MILIDTSAWVEFDRATGSAVDHRLVELLEEGDAAAITEPIVMEVLAGARDRRRELDLRGVLGRCRLLPFDSAADFESAARIYRDCRAAGVTPRGMIDCMVAAVAWRTEAILLSHDADLARVATVIEVELDEASFGAGR